MGRIYYATNRNPDIPAGPRSFGTDFNGPEPGNLTFGIADVNSPAGHDDNGLPIEAPTAGDVSLSDPSPGDFSAAAKQAIINGPAQLILSVQGPRHQFWDSVTRADYLARWFNEGTFPSPCSFLMFGWPSAGKFSEYPRDWQYSTKSGPALAQMLIKLQPLIAAFRAQKGAAGRVTLLAHSMGSHVVGQAMDALSPAPPWTYDRIILAAADEGRNELTPPGKLAVARYLADRVYVYYNNQDFALTSLEQEFHSTIIRLGVDGPPNKDDFKGANVTFVNASAAGVGNAENGYDSEGHQYYRVVQEVRNDICAVMRGMSDEQIPNRVYRDDPKYGWENYWRINTIAQVSARTRHTDSKERGTIFSFQSNARELADILWYTEVAQASISEKNKQLLNGLLIQGAVPKIAEELGRGTLRSVALSKATDSTRKLWIESAKYLVVYLRMRTPY